jgi:C_GCAxxG_C_C family probable redox protein
VATHPNASASEIARRIKEAGDHAERLRQRGFHCSEAVLRAAAAAVGVALDASLLKASTGLRGGGGGRGDRCGALEAGALLAGFVYGRTEPEEDNSCASRLVRWLHERFVREFGSTACQVLRPLSYTQWSDDFSCGPVYRRGAELAAEAILTAPSLCLTCPPYDPARGQVERPPVDAAVLQAVGERIRALASEGHVMLSERARLDADELGVSLDDVVFSVANARRVHPAWGGHYTVEGRKPDRYGLITVVRLGAAGDGEVVEVLAVI